MKHFFFNSLHYCLALLLAANSAKAQIQESPLDTQILPTGQMFSLIIKGDGESDPPARISAEGLPPESVFLRNLDGSRTFMWIPDDDDVGTNSFLVTIADGSDEQIFATYPINLEVINPAAATANNSETADNIESAETADDSLAAQANNPVQDSAVADDQDGQPVEVATAVDSETSPASKEIAPQSKTAAQDASTLPNTPADNIAAPTGVSAAGQLPAATVVDIASEAELSSSATGLSTQATPTQSTTGDSQLSETAQPLVNTDTSDSSQSATADSQLSEPARPPVNSDTTDTTDSDALGSDTGQSTGSVYPVLIVPDEVTISIDKELTVQIEHSSDNGRTQLRAINLPQGASLTETPSGHVLVWTPTSQDMGSTAVILTASDAENTSLSTTRRLAIEVTR